MNRGTVMETAGQSAIVLTPDGQFLRVKTGAQAAVGEEISWSEEELAPRRTESSLRRRWVMSGASAAVLLLLIFGLWSFRTPPVVAYVSMDINPSVEFGLDAQERVRELRAVNDDAVPIIRGVSYKGEPVEKVMAVLARKLTDSRILHADGGEIVIASVRIRSVDQQWETQVTDKIKLALQQATAGQGHAGSVPGLNIETVYLPVEVREEAKANGISSGKMAFWLAAENGGHDVPLTQLKKESVKKIADSIGGLKKVMEEGHTGKVDKQSWKQLLQQQKEKRKKLENQNKPSVTPSPDQPQSPKSPEPTGRQTGDKSRGQNGHEGGSQDLRGADNPNGNGQDPHGGQNQHRQDGKEDQQQVGKQDQGQKNGKPKGQGTGDGLKSRGKDSGSQDNGKQNRNGENQGDNGRKAQGQSDGKPKVVDRNNNRNGNQGQSRPDVGATQNRDGGQDQSDSKGNPGSSPDGHHSDGGDQSGGGNRQHNGQRQDDGNSH